MAVSVRRCIFFEEGEVKGYVLVLVEGQERRDAQVEMRVMLVEKCEELGHGSVEIGPKCPFDGRLDSD